MRKLLINFFAVVVVMLACFGCSCNKDDKVSLRFGDMNSSTYKDIDTVLLNKMISNEENFVLFVYQIGCRGCDLFKPVLNSVIKEKHLIVYGINIWSVDDDNELHDVIEYTPSLVLYEEGEIELVMDPDKNDNYFVDKEGLISYFNKYTNAPTAYYIDKLQLDKKIENKEDFIIYYSRKSCEDCSYLNRNYLLEYLDDNRYNKHFYILEVDAEGIRLKDGLPNDEQWQLFKDNYGLSSKNNPLGHGVGYVPTFQYYEDGKINDVMVYFNDIDYENGGYIMNDEGSFVIINNSYYGDHPYLNQTMKLSEYKEKVEGFYNNKLKQFLDINLIKVN